ncbi:MAG: polyhydroxyalkanoic acid system family protein [Burkholderiaceae bacterium]
MANLKFERAHTMGLDGARGAAERVATEMADNYDFNNEWQGNVLHFKRSGVKGTLSIEDERIELNAKLGVLLAAFAPKIQAQLDQNFDQYFS